MEWRVTRLTTNTTQPTRTEGFEYTELEINPRLEKMGPELVVQYNEAILKIRQEEVDRLRKELAEKDRAAYWLNGDIVEYRREHGLD
jgi:hypothetical protein